jgi:hypothetical protein
MILQLLQMYFKNANDPTPTAKLSAAKDAWPASRAGYGVQMTPVLSEPPSEPARPTEPLTRSPDSAPQAHRFHKR